MPYGWAGASIVGQLDLGELTLRCPLELYECYPPDPVDLAKAEAFDISLPGSRLEQGLSAYRLQLKHDLTLTEGFHCSSQTDLKGAHIGNLQLDGATLTSENKDREAPLADRLTIDNDLFLPGATVTGQLRLLGAHIAGRMNCRGAMLTSQYEDREALVAGGLAVGRDLFLSDATVTGQLQLLGAHIGGELDCTGATLKNPGGPPSASHSLPLLSETSPGGKEPVNRLGVVRFSGRQPGRFAPADLRVA